MPRNLQIKDFCLPSVKARTYFQSLGVSPPPTVAGLALAADLGQCWQLGWGNTIPELTSHSSSCEVHICTHYRKKSVLKDSLNWTMKLFLFFFCKHVIFLQIIVKKTLSLLGISKWYTRMYNHLKHHQDLIWRMLTSASIFSYEAKHTVSSFHGWVFSLLP